MKKLSLKNLSITVKMAVSLGLLITFLMLMLGFFAAHHMTNTVQAGEENQGRYLSEVLSARVLHQLETGNNASIKGTIREFMAETGVQGAVVIDAQGKIAAIEGVSRASNIMGELSDFDAAGFKMKYVKEANEADSAFVFIRQINNAAGQTAGYVGLSTSAGYLHRNTNSLISYLGATTVAAIIAGIFLSMIITRRFLNRPLTALAAATEHIATGNFSTRVSSRNQDELGNLASSFNMMTGYLSNLFRSITTYTAELVKSCQSLNNAVKSTEKASKQLAVSMQEHAGRTGEHISMLKSCAHLADGLVERVEHSGRELKATAGEILAIASESGEPSRLMAGAEKSVDEVQNSLIKLKSAAGDSLVSFGEMKRLAGVFSDYLDRSRAFNFKLAMEVARLGGRDLNNELDDLQRMADEGMEKTRAYIGGIDDAARSVETVLKSLEKNIAAVEQSKQNIASAGACWESLRNRMAEESQAIDNLINSLGENEKQRSQLLESLEYMMEELDKALKEFKGTGEAGEKQSELLAQLESTMRRILRVSNSLNNLCLQFKV